MRGKNQFITHLYVTGSMVGVTNVLYKVSFRHDFPCGPKVVKTLPRNFSWQGVWEPAIQSRCPACPHPRRPLLTQACLGVRDLNSGASSSPERAEGEELGTDDGFLSGPGWQ